MADRIAGIWIAKPQERLSTAPAESFISTWKETSFKIKQPYQYGPDVLVCSEFGE